MGPLAQGRHKSSAQLVIIYAFVESRCALFNQVARKGMPPAWNLLTLTSLNKKGNQADPSNYCGLAVMSLLPKLYATCLNALLYAKVTDAGIDAPT